MGATCGGSSKPADMAPQSEPTELFDFSGSGPWFACKPDSVVQPRIAMDGPGSREADTLNSMVLAAAKSKGDKAMLLIERPCPPLEGDTAPPALPREQWESMTYQEYANKVREFAQGFVSYGYQQFETVNIWGFNSPEWFIACMASMLAGGKVGGIYPTDTSETAAYKVVHSGGSIICVDDKSKIDKLVAGLKQRGDATNVRAFVLWGDSTAKAPKEITVTGCGSVPIRPWAEVITDGANYSNKVQEISSQVLAGHCATLIYTSGTTGEPKAVMLSHDSVIFESMVMLQSLSKVGFSQKEEEERVVSYLPLSHIAGFLLDIIAPITTASTTPSWGSIFFSRQYDLKVGSIKDRLCVARPTMFLGVPLVWEKFADRIRAVGAAGGALQQKIGTWAKSTALDSSQNQLLGGTGNASCTSGLALTILNKVKVKVGLDACKFAITGAAPIRRDTLEYFGSLGIRINEVYGMSECAGCTTISTPLHGQWGSCGYALPGVEVKVFTVNTTDFNSKQECPKAPSLDSHEDVFQGEICFRGRHIMMGYLAQPAMGSAHVNELTTKTAETIDKDGWLHSGDKGMCTVQGMFKITGRYKELIIGEGGENIAPVPIEDEVKKTCDGIAEIMMVGDQRKYNVALVTLKAKGANGEIPGTDQLDAAAERLSPGVTTISKAMDDDLWIKTITKALSTVNANGSVCPNNAFKIQKFTILPTNFSEQDGHLTPTKKLKRKVVEKQFQSMIDKMYKTDGTYIRFELRE